MRISYLLMAGFIGLSGCAATGVEVKHSQLDSFKRGETSQYDVVTALGKPTTQMRHSDGTSTLVYNYSEYRTRPQTFIPYLGMFIGGADTRSSNVSLTFDSAGKLLHYETAESEMGSGMGLAAGDVQAVPDQPRRPVASP